MTHQQVITKIVLPKSSFAFNSIFPLSKVKPKMDIIALVNSKVEFFTVFEMRVKWIKMRVKWIKMKVTWIKISMKWILKS